MPIETAPLQMEIGIVRAMVNGEPRVVLQVATPAGMQVYYLNLDTAMTVADTLRAAAGGIVLPGASPEMNRSA